MKILCTVGTTLAAVLGTALVAADGSSVSVDCSGGTPGTFSSISAALASLPLDGPHLLSVRGVCQETVHIDGRRNLTIAAPDGAVIHASWPTVTILNSTGIALTNVTIRGGGLNVAQSAVDLNHATSEQSDWVGLVIGAASLVRIQDGKFHDNAGPGLLLDPGATLQMSGVRSSSNAGPGILSFNANLLVEGGVTLEDNGGAGLLASGGVVHLLSRQGPNMIRANRVGIRLTDGVSATFTGENVVREHRAFGMEVSLGASVNIEALRDAEGVRHGAVIEQNGTIGINFAGSASANFSGPHRIANNGTTAAGSPGLRVGSTSRVQFGGGSEITGNSGPGVVAEWNAAVFLGDTAVTNNAEEGVRVLRNAVTMLGGVVSGNAGASVTCDTTGLVVLETSAITGVRCSRVERENGPPRPGTIR